jgi:hypothetical protein
MIHNTKKLVLALVLSSSLFAPIAFADDEESTGILAAIVNAITSVVNPSSNIGQEIVPGG